MAKEVIENENSEKFAEGFCFYKIFLIFIVGCIFGVIYEELILNFFRFLTTGTFEILPRRGLLYGPFSPVYGFGAVIMSFFVKEKRSIYKTFIYTALTGGIVEYLTSFLQETFTGTVSWDYTGKLLNINGRTTIIFMIVWGILGVVFVHIIYPFLSNLIEKIPPKIGNKIMPIVLILMCLNMFLSFSAVIRQNLRRNDIKPFTKYGIFLDKHYDDERLKKTYNNMIVK